MGKNAAAATWAFEDALPEKEGEDMRVVDLRETRSLQDLRDWCERKPESVGFALRRDGEDPSAWGFYPKKRDTGFAAGSAKWLRDKHGAEKWQFHYMRERAGPQDEKILPDFMQGATSAADWGLSKKILEHGRGEDEDMPKAGDFVVYRVHAITLNNCKVPGVRAERCQAKLGSGDICEALEFGLLRMKVAERARLRAPWVMLSEMPPAPADAAQALVEGKVTHAELDVELVSFEAGPERKTLDVLDAPLESDLVPDEASEEDAREQRVKQVGELIERAKEAKEEGTRLFKAKRFILALSRYVHVANMLMMLELNSDFEPDPMMGMMGFSASHIHEGLQMFRTVLGDELTSEAKALIIAAHLNTALCWLQLKEWAKAVHSCDKVLSQDSANVKAYYRKAQARLGLKEYRDACTSLREALKLDPENVDAQKLLGEASQKGEG